MQLKHATEYKCFLVNTSTLSTAEEQLNELFEDGWCFHTYLQSVLPMVVLPIMPSFIARRNT